MVSDTIVMLNKYGEYTFSYAQSLIGQRVRFTDRWNKDNPVVREGLITGTHTGMYGVNLQVTFKEPYGGYENAYIIKIRTMVKRKDVIELLGR